MSSGNSLRIASIRSRASLDVMLMSRSQSLNWICTPAPSARLVEFIEWIPGSVDNASSAGRVMLRSTSWGVGPQNREGIKEKGGVGAPRARGGREHQKGKGKKEEGDVARGNFPGGRGERGDPPVCGTHAPG